MNKLILVLLLLLSGCSAKVNNVASPTSTKQDFCKIKVDDSSSCASSFLIMWREGNQLHWKRFSEDHYDLEILTDATGSMYFEQFVKNGRTCVKIHIHQITEIE